MEQTKPKRKNKLGAGAPIKPVDIEKVEKLSAIGCNAEIIAACMDVDVSTIENKYSGIIKKGRGKLRNKLLAAQYEKAINKLDTSLLIFLGKVWLEQKEKQEIEHSGEFQIRVNTVDFSSYAGVPGPIQQPDTSSI